MIIFNQNDLFDINIKLIPITFCMIDILMQFDDKKNM